MRNLLATLSLLVAAPALAQMSPKYGLIEGTPTTLTSGTFTIPAASCFSWTSRGSICQPADGQFRFRNSGDTNTTTNGLIVGTADANGIFFKWSSAGNMALRTGADGGMANLQVGQLSTSGGSVLVSPGSGFTVALTATSTGSVDVASDSLGFRFSGTAGDATAAKDTALVRGAAGIAQFNSAAGAGVAGVTVWGLGGGAGPAGGTFRGRATRGTYASPSATTSSDVIAKFASEGYAGATSTFQDGAQITMEATETWTTNQFGSQITFSTVQTGLSSITTRWRITNDGHLLALGDASYNIGANAATRPLSLFFAGTLNANNRQTVTVDSATTFAIASSNVLLECTGAETINTITGGVEGTVLLLENTDTDCTIADDDDATAANAVDLIGSANDVGAVKKLLILVYKNGSWMQASESDN